MEIDFQTWKKFVEGAKITSVELKSPNSLYFEFDTGMVCYIYSDKPLQFDYNWLMKDTFLSDIATLMHVKKLMLDMEVKEMKWQVDENIMLESVLKNAKSKDQIRVAFKLEQLYKTLIGGNRWVSVGSI